VELTADWQVLADTRLYGTYTFMDTLNLETGNQLARRPRDKFTIGVDQYFWERGARIGAQMLFVGNRVDSENIPLESYTLVNLNGSLYLTHNAELFWRIDNLLDENYVEIAGYGTPGIAGYVGMNVQW
jgi:vitamin B12 transporter